MPVEDLAQAVGEPVDDAYVIQCWAQATALVSQYVEGSIVVTDPVAIPLEIVDRATLECSSELYHRRNAPNGVAQFATFDGPPIRVARDPMVGAYPILNRYLVVNL